MSYDFNVSMYQGKPEGIISLDNLIENAQERLKLYQIFEKNDNLSLNELKTHLKYSPFRFLLNHENSLETKKAREINHQSHWLLRVASSELQHSTFIKNELRWFKICFNNMTQDAKAKFMEKNNFVFTPISETKKTELNVTGDWYKFLCHEVPSLVRLRLYPLEKGYIYIPHHKLIFWVLRRFEKEMEELLDHAKIMLPMADDTWKMIVDMLNLKQHVYGANPVITAEDIDNEFKRFPLCMKIQHETLRETHHLKYFSRMQYGLFLKWIGLPLDQALEFWKTEFTNTMSESTFIKQYSYYIKHQYGTVGGRIDYKPYTCENIMDQTPAQGQVNGCPFKHWDDEVLQRRLQSDIPGFKVDKVMELKKKDNPKKACSYYFSCMYMDELDMSFKTPNDYYKANQNCCISDIEDMLKPSLDSDSN